MTTTDLDDEFVSEVTERRAIAAVVADPRLYLKHLDAWTDGLFVSEAERWRAVVTAIESDKTPQCPKAWKVSSDPVAAIEKLSDLFQRRLLAKGQDRVSQALYDKKKSASEVIGLLEKEVTAINEAIRELGTGRIVSLPSVFGGLIEELRERQRQYREDGTTLVGIPSGIRALDNLTGGWQEGVHLFAAQPGMGKTTFCVQIGCHAAKQGVPVLFVTFEESVTKLAMKAVCQLSLLEMKPLSDGKGEVSRFERAVEKHAPTLSSFYLLEGTSKLTVQQLKLRARAAMRRHKAKKCLIVVDYLQRWSASKNDFDDYRHVVSGLVSELRELSLALKSPVLAISSQNRPGQGKASLTSLKESGDLEYSADTALFLVEPKHERGALAPERDVDLVAEKNRYGDVGRIELTFRPDVGRMVPAAEHGDCVVEDGEV